MKSLEQWSTTVIGRSFLILSKSDRKKVLFAILIQITISILDLLGVAAIGLLGALSVLGIQSGTSSGKVYSLLKTINLENQTFQVQSIILGISAVLLLVGRTFFSIYFTRRILFFLSRRGAAISSSLVSKLLTNDLVVVQVKSTQDRIYALTHGVQIMVIQVLAATIILISDVSLLIVMTLTLFVLDFYLALSTMLLLGILAMFFYRFIYAKARLLATESTELTIQSNEKISEVLQSYREVIVGNRRNYYAAEIGKIRFKLADMLAEMGFMPYSSKYIIESTVVLGALVVGALQFISRDAVHAVGALAVFLAAGSRIAPAILRVQQGAIQIRQGIGFAKPTLDLMDELGDSNDIMTSSDKVDTVHEGFIGEIRAVNVGYTYSEKTLPAISGISIEIGQGKSVAIVGSSGAGKTTLVDVLLGVLTADEGLVTISGVSPTLATEKWQGAIAYVPQDVVISKGTIRENVSLGYPLEVATDELVMNAIKVAHLEQFVASLPDGLETQVGERGTKISGGQRQRLGIARAMFTKPLLLILDEATSSLDGETEEIISTAIRDLRGLTTVVMIAHRLSTVRNADMVIYLGDGQIKAVGTFEEVREKLPDFERQARLMGL
jgi:ABC-type multidrug transport system fused ATPase/permease subunit